MSKVDWYAKRHDLNPGMIFRTADGCIVKLDRSVPGDGTRWYVLDYQDGSWFCEDSTIEPGDLEDQLTAADIAAVTAAQGPQA